MLRPLPFALYLGLIHGFTIFSLPPVIDELMGLYGVSYAGLSILLTALQWSHAAVQFPAGYLTDRFGQRTILLISLVCVSLGSLLPLVQVSLGLAIIGRAITGIGTGLSFITLMKLIATHAPEGRAGTYQGYLGGLVSLGHILPFLILPHLPGSGWRWAFLLPGVFYLLGLAGMARLRLKPEPVEERRGIEVRAALTNRTGWVLGLYHALAWGSIMTLGAWFPSILAEARGSVTTLAWGGVVVMIVSALCRFAGGRTMAGLGPVRVANGTTLVLGLVYLAVYAGPSPWLLLVLAMAAIGLSSINFAAFWHLAALSTEPKSLATLFGLINLLANLGAILFTMLLGLVKDASGSFISGFGVLGVVALVAYLIGRRRLLKYGR